MATYNSIREVEAVIEMNRIILRERKRKAYEPRKNPFLLYSDEEFRQKYRFTKSDVRYFDQLIGDSLNMDKRGGGLSSKLQILTALRCWGRNQIQDDSADIHGLKQQSITNVCRRVPRAILEKRHEYLKMPSSLEEELQAISKFERLAGFKGVIGAIDCTHIRISKINGEQGQFYINRKGYSSLNVQVVCDAQMKIKNIVAHWRGSTHDARIFNESSIKQQFEDGHFHGRLMGDSGYGCTSYLFTPILNPSTRKEEAYNHSHIRTRNCIEKCFGVWKNRFRCLLDGFRTSLQNTKMYIVALAVLHNIALEINEAPFEDGTDVSVHPIQPTLSRLPIPQSTQRGSVNRATFIEENF